MDFFAMGSIKGRKRAVQIILALWEKRREFLSGEVCRMMSYCRVLTTVEEGTSTLLACCLVLGTK